MNHFFIDSRIFEMFQVKYANESMLFCWQRRSFNTKLAPCTLSKAHLIS
jgi:hypothetical protein